MKEKQNSVLVTGATGFIGRKLVEQLERDGYNVRCAVRTSAGFEHEAPVGSIGATTNWDDALTGVDIVIHLAARVHHPGEEHAAELYDRVNTKATLQLARSAARARVRLFLFMSTILVNGSCTDGRPPFNESDSPSPRGIYGKSKRNAEVQLRGIAADSEMAVAVIRPPLVYGAGAVGNFRHLVKGVARSVPFPFGSIRNRRAFICVENLISFVQTVIKVRPGGFRVFLVRDDVQISTPEFVGRIGRAMNRRTIIVPFPVGALDFALRLVRPELRNTLIGSMEVDASSALSLGWKPPYTMNEALRLATSP